MSIRFLMLTISALVFSALSFSIYADIDNSAQNMLHQAILKNSAEEIAQAVKAGANVNHGKDGKAPILWAVLLKRSNAIKELLKYGVNTKIVYLGHPLTHHAVNASDTESVIMLVKNGADFTGNIDQTKNIMDYAIGHRAAELIQELINRGWNIHNNTDGYVGSCSLNERITNIWWYGISSVDLIKLFVKNGANPNQIIFNSGFLGASWTPLLRAIEHQNIEAIKVLLSVGADVNQSASPRRFKTEKHTPLSYAIAIGNTEIVELLIEHGANL